jgi:hypothetical protein
LAALLWCSAPAPDVGEVHSDRAVEGRAVVFMLAEDDPTGRSVAEAVEAKIGDLDAILAVETLPESTELRDRLSAARDYAKTHDAIGVFWLEVEAEGALLLHLVDPEGVRMLVRRVEPSPESDTAAVQTIAVIARGFSSALLEGRSIGLSEVETAARPTDSETAPMVDTQTATAKTPRGRFRLTGAYYGARIAPQEEWQWQSGLALSAAWQWPIGIYAGAGYDVTQRLTAVIASAEALNTVAVEVRRNPAAALIGYQYNWVRSRIGVEGEVRFMADVHTIRIDEEVEGSIVVKNELSPFLLLSPRVGFHFRPVPYFSASLTVGAEVILVGQEFRLQFTDRDTGEKIDERQYLTPHVFRPLVLAGVNFYL